MPIRIATSGMRVTADVRANLRAVKAHLRSAAARGAHVVHFPECALSGYAGIDLPDLTDYPWSRLRESTEVVQEAAAALGLHVILGSTHRLSGDHKPHNSVYVIGPDGRLRDRYDKLFCAGPASADAGDLAHYSPGDHFCVVDIAGVPCGVLICHDYRYPELYRQYARRGVRLVFHSYHAGNMRPARWAAMNAGTGPEHHRFHGGAGTLPGITMPATMISMAANNYVWISASNTSTPQSCWASFVVRPDGVIVGRLRRNRSGLLFTDVDPDVAYYDSTIAWRDRAIDGRYHSGERVDDPRSKDRQRL